MFDELLTKIGLKYEDLSTPERDTYNSWIKSIANSVITVDSIREHIESMRDSVEQELEKSDNPRGLDLHLKARLKNYRLLLAFLGGPDRAKKALERMVTAYASNK